MSGFTDGLEEWWARASSEERDNVVAEEVMGWEHLRCGYYGMPEDEGGATPRQKELREWLERNRVGDMSVGEYFIDVAADFWTWASDWSPSTEISAAWEVVDKMRDDGWDWRVSHIGPNGTVAEFDAVMRMGAHARCDTTPEAICKAALLACGYDPDDPPPKAA